VKTGVQKQLVSIFGRDVSFDQVERKLYSHDVGSIPKLIKPFMPAGLPDAVVRPENEQALVELLKVARAYGVAVVPRGAASSGYGGAVPEDGAVVVDMRRFRRVLAVDRASMTATVEAGAIWQDVEAVLAKEGLALTMYPSSLPGSTVGGWLAQGGAGFGSYRNGYFKDVVSAARLVLPTGDTRILSGADLDLVADAEGTTGFITQVTFRVQMLARVELLAASFSTPEDLQAVLAAVAEAKTDLWSVSFLNPAAIELDRRMPAKTHHGHPMHDGPHAPEIPVGFVVMFAWDAKNTDTAAVLHESVSAAGGVALPAEVAQHEWDLRFKPMRLKRLGPSIVPTEVVVPLEALAATLRESEARVKLPLVIEGMGVSGREYVLLGFIPHDERKLGFNAAFGLSLSVIKAAEEQGGRPYSTGMYFKGHAEQILGVEHLTRLQHYKDEVDPGNIMNPGKIWGGGSLTTLMGAAESMEPAVRVAGNAFGSEVGETFHGGKHGIPDDVAEYAYACAQCGYCVDPCEQYSSRGWESHSPRGKWYYLREVLEGREKFSQEMVTKVLLCTTCEWCEHTCPLDLPIEPSWVKLRGLLINDEKKMTIPPFEIMSASLEKEGNIWAAYRSKRADWMPEGTRDRLPEKAKIAYFAGCTASYVEPDIGQGTVALLEAAGVEFTYLGEQENCCGIPMLVSGKWDVWEANMRKNIDAMKAKGVETVVSSCPACHLVWKTYYPDWCEKLGIEYKIESKHYSEVVQEQVKSGKISFPEEVPMTVTFHDSCHLGRASGIYEPPRELLRAIPGVELREMAHNREQGLCCGSVLTLIGEPPVAHKIGDARLQEAVDIGVKDVVALCPCCQFQLRVSADRMGTDVRIHDLSHLVAKSMGIDLVDPTPYALTMWAVFEQMVYLMEPAAMARLMEELFPQMIDAMPMGMGKMMRAMGKVPGALGLMKSLMPKLFPLLMPSIMPKVMPDMIAAVGRRIDMPDDMREQMPDLLPKTMEQLMPNMLPMLMPYIVPSMIAYLKKGQATEEAEERAA
jgi:Fe-S oxidoreductase/FAD/FMN-containing dehydrogenase